MGISDKGFISTPEDIWKLCLCFQVGCRSSMVIEKQVCCQRMHSDVHYHHNDTTHWIILWRHLPLKAPKFRCSNTSKMLRSRSFDNYRKVIFTMLTLTWSLQKDKHQRYELNGVKYNNSTQSIRNAAELLMLRHAETTTGSSAMVKALGTEREILGTVILPNYRKRKSVTKQGGKKNVLHKELLSQ